ncbi:MAG: hypothetical protein VZR54_01350 [Ruminococcus sp.]|nr:hypothetical protein [Ruminococcus sp.]
MTGLINFISHNIEPLVFVLVMTLILSVALTIFYFFVYSYVINKRMQNPEKKHRIKLIMPRFACIILVVLSFLCSMKLTNKQISIGACSFSTFWYLSGYDFVQAPDEVITREELDKNKDFERYTQQSEYFKYTLYYNKVFNGIIDINSKNCEYVIFVEYIGKDKNLNRDSCIEMDAQNYDNRQGNQFGFGCGGGYSQELGDSPFVLYGDRDVCGFIGIESDVYKKSSYDRMYMASDDDEEYDERDYQYLNERVNFDFKKMSFSAPKTEVIGN